MYQYKKRLRKKLCHLTQKENWSTDLNTFLDVRETIALLEYKKPDKQKDLNDFNNYNFKKK